MNVQADHFELKKGELTLDLTGLTKGMYIVALSHGRQIIKKRLKILKQ
jgi:hypothetical protein